ncbi:phenylalanine--tRNA ligase subunit alpha [Chitinispirillales bacterium ANBcel5]|uniref:phenylalanine--tRNA ligase subunit alpha n=1 Tax=Cellulosispirillum alkaliphilum TaxID=3039283 RepID=UPI002A563DD5|nr:phenylalanine--tRNA ligase subunit alpha [Chitinispirillales bacterium ANBcel5]
MTEVSDSYTLDNLDELESNVLSDLKSISNESEAESFRIKYLGKKGVFRQLLKSLGSIDPQKRKEVGAKANRLRSLVETEFSKAHWKKESAEVVDKSFDPSLPGFPFHKGSLHPLMQIRDQIRDIFISMGFTVSYGPEVESDFYNFEALNTPKHHPARDMQDTFYIDQNHLLRTHTSPVQIRVMENQKPPIRSIMPGRVYRNEEISARSYCLFHQVEGLYVDKDVSFADLKGTLLAFSKRFFDEETKIKIRPSFFPFTEPSVEIDVECFLCKGQGCSICKQSGWLEVLGAGMVHPNVFKSVGIDPEKYTGFAFGMGIERIALLKFGIDDIRLFYENDTRFLSQF